MLDGGADFDNAFVLDQDFARRDYFSAFDIEKTRGMEDDLALCAGRS